ncbi:MAG: DMT family transporter [Ilumatobacteraceae bacterium]
MPKNSFTRGGTVALAITVLSWATAFPAIRTGLTGFSPWALGSSRLVVASVALAIAALIHGIDPPPRAWWPRVILAGLIGQTLYQGLLMTGETTVPAGTASLLIATAPLFSVAAAGVLLREPIGRALPGMALAFAGAALVGASLGLGGGTGALIVLAAAACQGSYHVVVKPLARAIGPFAATAWSVWAGTLLALPALPLAIRDARTAPGSSFAAIVALGVVSSALGYLAWSIALSRASIVRTTAALYLVPVVALLLSWAWLGERPAPAAVIGGALAIVGVVLVRRAPDTRGTNIVAIATPSHVVDQQEAPTRHLGI